MKHDGVRRGGFWLEHVQLAAAQAQFVQAQTLALVLEHVAWYFKLDANVLRTPGHDRVSAAGRVRQTGRDLVLYILCGLFGWPRAVALAALNMSPRANYSRALDRLDTARQSHPPFDYFVDRLENAVEAQRQPLIDGCRCD